MYLVGVCVSSGCVYLVGVCVSSGCVSVRNVKHLEGAAPAPALSGSQLLLLLSNAKNLVPPTCSCSHGVAKKSEVK